MSRYKINGTITFPFNTWICNSDPTNNQKMYIDNGAKTCFRGGGITAAPSIDDSQAGTDLYIDGLGVITQTGSSVAGNNISYLNMQIWALACGLNPKP
jgi:hypothetical protein